MTLFFFFTVAEETSPSNFNQLFFVSRTRKHFNAGTNPDLKTDSELQTPEDQLISPSADPLDQNIDRNLFLLM